MEPELTLVSCALASLPLSVKRLITVSISQGSYVIQSYDLLPSICLMALFLIYS